MKKIIFALLALAVVGLYSCEKENDTPSGNNSTNQGGDIPTPSDTTVTPPAPTETFYGDWNLVFVEGASLHYNLVTESAIQSIIPSMENDMSLAGNVWDLTIEQASGTQVNVTGSVSIDLGFQGVPAIPLSFQTTGTITNDGLNINPAEINQSITAMNVIPVDLTGTVTFVQPTALPVDGNLTVTIATLDVNGVGEASFGTVSGGLTLTVNGTQLQATGPRADSANGK